MLLVGCVVGVFAAVTVNVFGVYAVTSDGRPVTHAAVTAAAVAVALAGMANVPLHAPRSSTENRVSTGGSVVAASVTSDAPSTRPGEHPLPLTVTVVPGGPDVGDMVNEDTPSACADGPCTQRRLVLARAITPARRTVRSTE